MSMFLLPAINAARTQRTCKFHLDVQRNALPPALPSATYATTPQAAGGATDRDTRLVQGAAIWALAVSTFGSTVAISVKLGNLVHDVTERGLGLRSGRYSMVVDDGVVKALNVEEGPGKAEVSGADNLLKSL